MALALETPACPGMGQTSARFLNEGDAKIKGPNAIGSSGDAVLMNDRAGFVISRVDSRKTYYYYGGILVDAFALQNCKQVGEEQFNELQLITLKTEAGDIYNDGSDGKAAIVRAYGSDEVYYIGEMELITKAFMAGHPRHRSKPITKGIVVDYILEPDSNRIRIEYNARFESIPDENPYLNAVLLSPGLADDLNILALGEGNFSGLELRHSIPWVSSGSAAGGYAFALDAGNMGEANFLGIRALFDLTKLGETPDIAKKLNVRARKSVRSNRSKEKVMFQASYVSVSGASESEAIRDLMAISPTGVPTSSKVIEGQVTRSLGPVGETTVSFQAEVAIENGRRWSTLVKVIPDETGHFKVDLPLVNADEILGYRLVAVSSDQVLTTSVPVTAKTREVKLEFPKEGEVAYRIVDQDGAAMPAKLSVYRNGSLVKHFYVKGGEGSFTLLPGHYEIDASRGMEYEYLSFPIDVAASEVTPLDITLRHVVDTSGYMAFDSHVHQIPSPDSRVSLDLRALTVAASGLDVVINTDHEFISDLEPSLRRTGVQDYVKAVVGQEVTAHLPNHIIMFPFPRDDSQGMRGNPVAWHGHDLGEIYAKGRERGAQVIALAHPRQACNYLCLIGWNSATNTASLQDPTLLFLRADQALWSWDFNAMEIINDVEQPFRQKSDVSSTGIFDDWINFLNAGHIIRPLAATDTHGTEMPGRSRTYFATDAARPSDLSVQDVVSDYLSGNVLISTGAFAKASVDGVSPGGLVNAAGGRKVGLKLHVEALPEIDVSHVRIYANCQEITKFNTTSPNELVKFDGVVDLTLPLAEDANIVVAGFGQKSMPRAFGDFSAKNLPRFLTNAIFVDRDGNGVYDAPGSRDCHYTLDTTSQTAAR